MVKPKNKRQVKVATQASKLDTKKPGSKGLKNLSKIVLLPFKALKIFKYIIPPYFKNAWKELRLVKWPSRKETWQLTLAVFAFAIVFGVLITVVDKGLDVIFKRILLK